MKIGLRKAKLDQKKASKLTSYNIRLVNQELLSQKKKLDEQLRREGKLQQFADYKPLDKLEFEQKSRRLFKWSARLT